MPPLSFGLALSGGTAKSVTHVGVLKAIVEAGLPVSHIAGTSGGSIVASMFSSGMPMSTLESIAMQMSWRKLVAIKLTKLGFISSERIEEFMKETIGDVALEYLSIPTAVIATNLITGDRRVFRTGPVARAVRASCSIPQIYLPVEIDGEYYVDGGLAEYLPVEALQETGCEFTVASHLGPIDPHYRRPHHILHLVIQVTGLMARKNYVVSEKIADAVIHPNLDRFGSFDFDHSDQMIEVGYNAAREMIDEVQRAWEKKSGFWGRLSRKLGLSRPNTG